ncbi:hypothetical protein Tco_0902846 [Tanacetum coccineum]
MVGIVLHRTTMWVESNISRANPQATIVSEEQLAPRKDTSWDIARLLILQILWGIVYSANLDFTSLIWDEFEWQAIDRTTKQSKMLKLMYTRFTKLIINHFQSCTKSDQELNVPNAFKKNVVPRKTRSLTIADNIITIDLQIKKDIEGMYSEWGQKHKGHVVEDLAVQPLLDLHKGSKASRPENIKQMKQGIAGEG